MPGTTTRRRFLGRSVQALGVLAWHVTVGGYGWPAERTSRRSTAMTEKAVAFLRSRQNGEGGWSTEREPGITALVATALLRSRRVTPADPAVTRALGYLERFLAPKGGLSEVAARQLRDVDRADGLPGGEHATAGTTA